LRKGGTTALRGGARGVAPPTPDASKDPATSSADLVNSASRRALALLQLLLLLLLPLAASIASSLAVFPHSLSYFNELAGGPENGPAHLLDANIDWGQDLLELKRWSDAHPAARPFHLAYFRPV